MTRRLFLTICWAALSGQARPAQKPKREPDIAILKMSSIRQAGTIEYEGDLKVTAAKPLNGLLMRVEFLDADGVLLSAQKIEIEEGTLSPGEERHISVQGHDVPRAVSFRISFTDRAKRDLATGGAGPYPLD
jgi:hypothetical protein